MSMLSGADLDSEQRGARAPSNNARSRLTSGVVCWSLAGFVFLWLGIIQIEQVPPVWWDEGWTLSVARNWSESGHYGRLLLGEPVSHGLQAAAPVTIPIGFAFKYFGVGLYQARLVIFAYLLGTVVLLFYLACRMFNDRIALGALFVLLLMTGNRHVHPIFMGRQILGEVPALFFLLAGYGCFLWAAQRSRVFVIGAIVFWSVAIITKGQVLPFWALSLIVPCAIALLVHRWVLATMFFSSLLGSAVLAYAWQAFITQMLFPNGAAVSGLYSTIGIVLDPLRRIVTVAATIEIGLPTLLGLVWALTKLRTQRAWETPKGLVKIALFVLAGSWFAWWVLASTGWPRYLFPAAFLASIFVSAMLYDWTDGFRFGALLRNLSSKMKLQKIRFAAAVFLIGWAFVQTTSDLADATIGKTNEPLMQTVDYLNNETPAESVVETYESELFFLLKRRYHYPPDQLHVELIRREDLSEKPDINYDPLMADPDYLVVGGWCRYYKCYNHVLTRENFKLVKAFGSYEIFQRVR